MFQRLAKLEHRTTPLAVGIVVLALLLALRWDTLGDPPYWDALMGAFPQGLWLARHDFDVVGLLTREPVYTQGGANVYPFSVYPPLVGALYAAALSRGAMFAALHVLSLASAAVSAAAIYAVARRRLPAPAGLLISAVFVATPLCQSLASQMNMDVLLVAATALSFEALDRRKSGRAAFWALAALLVKPTAVILIGANLVCCALLAWRPRWCGLGTEGASEEERARARRGVWLHAALLVVFCAQVALLSRYATGPAYVELFGGWKRLFGRVVWVIPEFGLALGIFFLGLPLLVKRMRGGHARWIQVHCAVFLVAFLLFYGQYTNPLPRYFLQAYPYLLMWLALSLYGSESHATVRHGLLLSAIGYHVFSWNGAVYPSRPSGWQVPGIATEIPGNDGYILERSMEYRDDLRLDLKLARALEQRRLDRSNTIVVANWPLLHLLAFPEFGYLGDAPGWRTSAMGDALLYDPNAVPYRELYDRSGATPRRARREQILYALSPNTFSGPTAPILPGDEVDSITIGEGARRAFLVRRPQWE